ncbi:MAG TPA: matrixin family metalloprotease, partial [Thermoanaerobaculia bacterium]|nr:matrixin family metalloprotease [Thermoanaerobaculia bacterium]
PAESFPLQYQLGSELSSHQLQVTRAFDRWSRTGTSAVGFERSATTTVKPGRDGVNSVSSVDQLFERSGMIAFTTAWFDGSGRIQEADIQIDPSALDAPTLEAIVEHEVGHLLGLDHSGVLSAIMYPFVSPGRGVTLDSDDIVGIRGIYPDGKATTVSTIRGTVRSDSGPLFAAHVVLVDGDGRPVAGTLTDEGGSFSIQGLGPGNYDIYVEPLDGPVDPRNFSGVWTSAQSRVFPTEFVSAHRKVEVSAESTDIAIQVPEGAVSLNPLWIGAFDPDGSEISLDSTVTVVRPGQRLAIAVGGDGFVGGMTKIEIPNAAIRRVSEFRYGSNFVWAVYEIGQEATEGSLIVFVESGTERATLTGGLLVIRSEGRPRTSRR